MSETPTETPTAEGAAARAWRDPAQVIGAWSGAGEVTPELFEHAVEGDFWDLLAERRLTLLVSREYEHLLLALGAPQGKPAVSYLALPHPSGLAVDRERGRVYVAATRNPNQVVELAPAAGTLSRNDVETPVDGGRRLVPVASRFFPGCLYLHDLAMVGGRLHGNAVGLNAVVRFDGGGYRRAWWPRCIERDGEPLFAANHLQLNSIAAGPDLESSFFSASGDEVLATRPGDLDYPVDRRGVIFAGRTREVVARGLTRPHSARLDRGRLWVDNSGYGELGTVEDGAFEPVARLPGWTRGLAFDGGVAFVGTSRILPRFAHYAPGLDPPSCVCGVSAVELATGRTLGSIRWDAGNQIFAVEVVPESFSPGFPFAAGAGGEGIRNLFYTFRTEDQADE